MSASINQESNAMQMRNKNTGSPSPYTYSSCSVIETRVMKLLMQFVQMLMFYRGRLASQSLCDPALTLWSDTLWPSCCGS